MSEHSDLRAHLKAINAAYLAHGKSFSAHDADDVALHDIAGKVAKAATAAFPGDHTVNGHLGQLAKVFDAHATIGQLHKSANDALASRLAISLEFLCDRAGVPFGTRLNPNAAIATGETATSHTEQDTFSPGSFDDLEARQSTGVDQAGSGTQKGYTAKQLADITAALAKTMANNQLGKLSMGRRLNKNARSSFPGRWVPVHGVNERGELV